MKTINHKIIYVLLLTIFQGCMPDSLTKFQKSTPKPQTQSTGVVVTDTSGNVVSGSSITYPTTFDYYKNNSKVTEWDIAVGFDYPTTQFQYSVDGSLATSTMFSSMFLRCEVTDQTGTTLSTFPITGIKFDTSACLFSGSTLSIYNDYSAATPTIPGKAIPYYVRMYFKNGKNLAAGTYGAVTCSTSECYISSSQIKIGSFKKPTDLSFTQTDKLGLAVSKFAETISNFKIDDSNFTTRTDVITTSLSAIGSIQIVDEVKNNLYIQRAIPLTVASTAGFAAGTTVGTFDTLILTNATGINPKDTVTSGSYTGIVNYVSGNTIRVFRTAPMTGASLASGDSISNGTVTTTISGTAGAVTLTTPIKGVLLSLDSTNKILRITQDPNYGNIFSVNDVVSPMATSTTSPGVSLNTTVSSIDTGEGIRADETIDNDTQFYSAEATVSNYISYYPVGTTITPIVPVIKSTNLSIGPNNGITYTISPALPSGLSFDSNTGTISGSFTSELLPTLFTLTATNPLNSTSASFKVASIYAPKDLSYTYNQLLTISNNVTNPQEIIYEGDQVFKSIVAPETQSTNALVRRRFAHPDSTRTEASLIEVQNSNGPFEQGASLDFGNRAYYSEKAYISAAITDKPINYNLIMYVNSVTPFATTGTNSYISNGSNALGRIVYINSVDKALYVQLLTPSVTISSGSITSTVNTFKESSASPEYLCNRATYSASLCVDEATTPTTTAKVLAVETTNYKLTLTNGSSYDYGSDVTANNGTNSVGGYVYSKPSTNVAMVNTVTKTPSTVDSKNYVLLQAPEFVSTQSIVADEYFPGSDTPTTITKVEHDNIFFADRNNFFVLTPNLSQGSSVNYTVTPALPAGLSINSSSGVISGTPTVITPVKKYAVIAKNLMGSTTFQFNLEVRDFFTIKEASNATSYILHKVGDTQNNRKCKINAADIKRGTGNLDIRCYLDGQEEDLHFEKLNFKALVGAGVCEYIQYAPFSFWDYAPYQSTTPTVSYVSGCTGDIYASAAAGAPTFASGSDDGKGIASGKYTTQAPVATNRNYCPGNYTGIKSEYPNCDEGKFTTKMYTTSLDSASGKCVISSVSTNEIKCGGSYTACMKGPINDILTDTQIRKGSRSMIYSVADGTTVSVTHKAPADYTDLTNLRVVNDTKRNSCTNTLTGTDQWQTATESYSRTTNPFGKETTPFYTFNCLDAAYDVKARIRVMIRDWDSSFKVTKNIDEENPSSGLMNRSNNNNYDDWDNNYTGVANQIKTKLHQGGCGDTHSGICSNSTYKNQLDCEDNSATWTINGECSGAGATPSACTTAGNTWTYGYCALTAATTSGTCSAASGTWSAGYCRNKTYTTQAACTTNKYEWVADLCHDRNNTTPTTCAGVGGTWVNDYDYAFPEENI